MENSIIYYINNSYGDLMFYYSTKDGCFYAMTEQEASYKNNAKLGLILAPCTYTREFKSEVWKEFRNMLSEEERAIADSYPYRRGYFNYLEEEGLIDTYYAAKECVLRRECDNWFKRHSLNLTESNFILM